MLPTWKPSFSVNHSILDEQHKMLFKLAAKVHGLSAHEFTKEKVRKLLLDFYTYMQTHFEEEEEYMEKIGYPRLEEHKILHQKLIDSMNDILKKSFNYQKMREAMKEVTEKWLLVHILKEDMEYENWRKENNIIDLRNRQMEQE